jgi:pimeloyl-ACP methyl ester carboxylesterase
VNIAIGVAGAVFAPEGDPNRAAPHFAAMSIDPPIRKLPSTEVVELPDTGHSPMSDDPSLVAKTILGFVARV